jgi:DNA-binding transcriptional ArsR family regulator
MTRTDEELCRCLEHVPKLRGKLLPRRKAAEKSRILHLMAHPTRLQILKLLSERDLCVCVLTRLLGKSQSNVSQHLSKLRDNGAIGKYHRGKLVYYHIEDRMVGRIMADIFG